MPLVLGRIGSIVATLTRVEVKSLLLPVRLVDRRVLVEEHHPADAAIVVPLGHSIIESTDRQRVAARALVTSQRTLPELTKTPDTRTAPLRTSRTSSRCISLPSHRVTATLLASEHAQLLAKPVLLHLQPLVHLLAEHDALAITDQLGANACEAAGYVVLFGVEA